MFATNLSVVELGALRRLRVRRLLAGLTLDEVGRRIGVSGSYLSAVERGYAGLSREKEKRWHRLLDELAPESLLSASASARGDPMG